VTILFSDLAGSTALGERMEPESLRAIMTRYFAAMEAAVERHGGTVEKFIGDAVMAVWGIPARREDDAVRAIRAALEMNAGQEQLNADLESCYGVRLSVRTGVNSGEVIAGSAQRGQAFVTGDAVNVAARLEQAAGAGEILLGAETRALAGDVALTEPVAPLDLKGKSAPVAAFRLLGLRTEAPPPAEAQLVGRERELAALEGEFATIEKQGGWRRITVIGQPGVGKTRLTDELAGRLSGRAGVVSGRCPSYGAGTWWPIAEIARAAAGIAADDATAAAQDKLVRLLGEEDRTTATVLAGLFGITEVAASAEEAGWAVRRLLERIAGTRPLVVILDDVQWATSALHDMLAAIEPDRGGAAVLVICLARPELATVRPELGAPPAVRLEPLPEHEAGRLATALAGAPLPASIAAAVLRAADGNPLFVGALVRMLRDDGLLEAEVPAVRVRVPPTIEALLAARLDQVGVSARTVAEHAAVIGEEFAREELGELLDDGARPGLDRHLEDLLRHELLQRVAAPAMNGWQFAHLLVRDVAYQGMLKKLRAELHERFADRLELRAGDRLGEYEEIVGHHLEQAYRYRVELAPLKPAERALGRRAAVRLLSAGRRALLRLDPDAAVALLLRAADIAGADAPERGEALLETAAALTLLGRFEEALVAAAEVAEPRFAPGGTTYPRDLVVTRTWLRRPGRFVVSSWLATHLSRGLPVAPACATTFARTAGPGTKKTT